VLSERVLALLGRIERAPEEAGELRFDVLHGERVAFLL
jgi:hypothetical protein